MINYYVYIHYTLDTNLIFYIGRGKNGRYKSKCGRNKFWWNEVNKHGFKYEIYQDDLDFYEACQLEIQLIKFYGRRDLGLGTLVNLTDGGEGEEGFKHSKSSKLKMSITTSKMTQGENNPFYGKKHSQETKNKISKTNQGKLSGNKNPFYGKKHDIHPMKGKHHSQETINKIREGNKNKTYTHKVIQCSHCLKSGGDNVMKRWHFDNCKYKND